jgi:hypothetical protein
MIGKSRYFERTHHGLAAQQAAADAFAKAMAPTLAEMQQQGLNLRQMAATLTSRNIPTRRGGTWTPTAVRRLLERVASG